MFHVNHSRRAKPLPPPPDHARYGPAHVAVTTLDDAERVRDRQAYDAMREYTGLHTELLGCEQLLAATAAELERLERQVSLATTSLELLQRRARTARISVARLTRTRLELRASLCRAGGLLGYVEAPIAGTASEGSDAVPARTVSLLGNLGPHPMSDRPS